MFSKTSCGFCHCAKAAFFAELGCSAGEGGHVDVLGLDRDARGAQIQAATLTEMYGQRTVPNVFVAAASSAAARRRCTRCRTARCTLQAMLDDAS